MASVSQKSVLLHQADRFVMHACFQAVLMKLHGQAGSTLVFYQTYQVSECLELVDQIRLTA